MYNYNGGATQRPTVTTQFQPVTTHQPTAIVSTCHNNRTVYDQDSSQVSSYMTSSPSYPHVKVMISKYNTSLSSRKTEKNEVYKNLRNLNRDLDKLTSQDWRNVVHTLMPEMKQAGFTLANEENALPKLQLLCKTYDIHTFEALKIKLLEMADLEKTKVELPLAILDTDSETTTFISNNKTDYLHSINAADLTEELITSEIPANDQGSITSIDEGLLDTSEDFELLNIDDPALTPNSNINHKKRITPWILVKRIASWISHKISKLRNHRSKVIVSNFQLLKSLNEAATIHLNCYENSIKDLAECNALLQKEKRTINTSQKSKQSIRQLQEQMEICKNEVKAAHDDAQKAINIYELQEKPYRNRSNEAKNNTIKLRTRSLILSKAWARAIGKHTNIRHVIT